MGQIENDQSVCVFGVAFYTDTLSTTWCDVHMVNTHVSAATRRDHARGLRGATIDVVDEAVGRVGALIVLH